MVFDIITCVIACGALSFTIIIFVRGKKETKSRFFLEIASKGFEEVINLLSDQNNNNQIWVRAARTLLKAKNLKKRIPLQEYLDGFEAVEERVRNELYTYLTILDEETGERIALPPQFFYGIDNWREIGIDEAAIQASGGPVVSDVTLDKNFPVIKDLKLSERSVVAIFDFLEYPKSYIDPLSSVNLWNDNWDLSFGASQGARRYIAHRKTTFVANGEVHKRNKKTE